VIAFTIALATTAYLTFVFGWQAGVVSFLGLANAYVLGVAAFRHALTSAGYVTEFRADGRGQKRWRVGRATAIPSAEVEWIAPGLGAPVAGVKGRDR
jgi:hypothetical protein